MRQNSYLLRFWHTAQSDTWRATLITVAANSVEHHFNSMDELFCHLREVYESTDTKKVIVNTEQLDHQE